MLAVIFEFEPLAERRQDYLDFAAALGAELETIDGFVSIERFESLSKPGRLVSISYWRDEAAIERWRGLERHRNAQRESRNGIMADYRLRVAQIIRDYGMQDRDQAPADSKQVHDQA